ncbi:hypothetical protein [uncultured Treponema sp.]|uniref:hypothetical protein n=1 Tax=uncultured Treponema sp. TaxID=162155 RepID=UPI0025D8D279|nr:hypothetical protein [uncultured Treponema sp.]
MKNLSNLFFCLIAGIFVSSCGLEEVLSLDAPTVTQNDPLYTSTDYLTWYSAFITEERSQPEQFIGTEVYYKIYNNYSSLTSQRSAILSVNTTSNSSAAATRMIETYTYQPLGTSVNTGRVVFIPNNGQNRRVIIRLKNYLDGSGATGDSDRYNFVACIGIYGETGFDYKYSGEYYIPYRNGNSKSFDFFDYNEDNKGGSRDVEPVEGDADYFYNSSGFSDGYDNTYFVQMFAVAKAWNTDTCAPSYSLVLDLGSVPIKKGE